MQSSLTKIKQYICLCLFTLGFIHTSQAQIGGDNVYEFINMPQSARVTALGGSLIALAEGMVFLLLGFTIDLPFSFLQFAAVTGFMLLVAIGLTSLGFIIAWRLDSSQGFHAIMSVFLLPMWLLSGAFFPPGDNVLGKVIRANPFTYAVAGLRQLLHWSPGSDPARTTNFGMPSTGVCVLITLGFTAICFILAWQSASRTTKGDLLS